MCRAPAPLPAFLLQEPEHGIGSHSHRPAAPKRRAFFFAEGAADPPRAARLAWRLCSATEGQLMGLGSCLVGIGLNGAFQ
jgi:hypothetical protein